MPTDCVPTLFDFAPVEGHEVVANFAGGAITSNAGGLLLGATDRVLDLTRRLAACFKDHRDPDLIEHRIETLLMQRITSIALGYEDLNDHDHLRHDPLMAALAGKLAASRSDCAPVAGKSTLNRLELSKAAPTRYAKIAADTSAIEDLFIDLFLDAHNEPPEEIILDLDATDGSAARRPGRQVLPRLRSLSSGRQSRTRGTATAICRSTSSAAVTCWWRNCARPISTPVPAAWRK